MIIFLNMSIPTLLLSSALKIVRGPRNLQTNSPNLTSKPNRQIFAVFYIYEAKRRVPAPPSQIDQNIALIN